MPNSPHYRPAFSTDRSVAEALHLYPDALTIKDACASANITNINRTGAQGFLTAYFENEAKPPSVANADPQGPEINLPMSLRIQMAKAQPETPEGNIAKATIYAGYRLSSGPGFSAWETEKAAKFFRSLHDDPLVATAQTNWDHLTIAEKFHAAQHIHNLQMAAHGAQPVILQLATFQEDEPAANAAYGQTETGEAAIRINANPESSLHGSFEKFIATLCHEGDHALVDQLSQRYLALQEIDRNLLAEMGVTSTDHLSLNAVTLYNHQRDQMITSQFGKDSHGWNSDLSANGRLRGTIEMFIYNQHDGYITDTEQNYFYNPTEQHARQTGEITETFLSKTPDARKQMIRELEANSQENNKHHQQEITARHEARWSGAMCPTPTAPAPF